MGGGDVGHRQFLSAPTSIQKITFDFQTRLGNLGSRYPRLMKESVWQRLDEALTHPAFASLRTVEVNILLRVDLEGQIRPNNSLFRDEEVDDEAVAFGDIPMRYISILDHLPMLCSNPNIAIQVDSRPGEYWCFWG